MTHNVPVRRVQPGNSIEVASGGNINILSGGQIQAAGSQAAAITDALTAGSATAADCATKINSILAALRGVGIIAP